MQMIHGVIIRTQMTLQHTNKGPLHFRVIHVVVAKG